MRYLKIEIKPNHISDGFVELDISGRFKGNDFQFKHLEQMDEFHSLFDTIFECAQQKIKELYQEDASQPNQTQ